MNRIKVLPLLLLLSFAACKKDNIIPKTKPGLSGVFVSGTMYNTAVYWQDTTLHKLPMLLGSSSNAKAILVSGSDLYVAGNDGNFAVIWKNGQEVKLNGGGMACGIALAGKDLYAAGTDNAMPVYWKNGIESGLPLSDGFTFAYTYSIAVSGSDVYVAGTQYNSMGGIGTLWKNGVPSLLSDSDTPSGAVSVVVSNGNVYVAGDIAYQSGTKRYGCAAYWKNGQLNQLSTVPSYANSIFVSGADVYVCGRDSNSNALWNTVWKNGTPTYLAVAGDMPATSVFVKDGAVYCTGAVSAGLSNIKIAWWKNAQVTYLSDEFQNDPYIGHIDGATSGIWVQ